MGCVVEVVTKLRSGIEDKEIARKKYILKADEVQLPPVCRELKYKLNITGVQTKVKPPTSTYPWFIMETPKSKLTFFEWRFLTGEEADIVTREYQPRDWNSVKGYRNP